MKIQEKVMFTPHLYPYGSRLVHQLTFFFSNWKEVLGYNSDVIQILKKDCIVLMHSCCRTMGNCNEAVHLYKELFKNYILKKDGKIRISFPGINGWCHS